MMPSCSDSSPDSTATGCSQCLARKDFAENVARILAWREISPTVKRPSRRLWGEPAAWSVRCQGHLRESTSAKHALVSWLETQSFKDSVARYCPLVPAPRSTIAAAFSPDGKTLASTHGDHTVKIICCRNGQCLKVLTGHRRTPWVVRYHPSSPEVLASGSLDYEVRLWNANNAECVASRDFFRPIASLAFHAQGDVLAVASGHKLYIWQYSKDGDESTPNPNIVLRTRRSLRAVHFHPLAAPLLLTAEVNDLDSPDCPMSVATSREYQGYTCPALQFSHHGQHNGSWLWTGEAPQVDRFRHSHATTLQAESSGAAPMDISPRPSNAEVQGSVQEEADGNLESGPSETGRVSPTVVGDPWDVGGAALANGHADNVAYIGNSSWGLPLVPVARRQVDAGSPGSGPGIWPVGLFPNICSQAYPFGGHPQLGHPHDVDFPFLQGWLHSQVYQQQSSDAEPLPRRSGFRPYSEATRLQSASNRPHGATARHHIAGFGVEAASAAAAAELPCTVKLKLWPHDIKNPSALLDPETCRLTIPHAVLCSEMGTHFSPCGRFLAACVACVMDRQANGSGYSVQSPTQHPISTQQVIYELRIYSLEEATFGEILASKAVRAAHCLTSIQFSPTSAHILLAYGRRHGSLLRSIVLDGTNTIPVYTILEIYRISDLKLIRVLPSAEDEVNVACFHPEVGGGLVYGTKEGKLRIIRRDWVNNSGPPSQGFEDQLLEAETSDPLTFGKLPVAR